MLACLGLESQPMDFHIALYFFLFHSFFLLLIFFKKNYLLMLCWLGFRVINLFWFTFYMFSKILKINLAFSWYSVLLKRNWFYSLQEIENERTKFFYIKNVEPFVYRNKVVSTFVIFLSFFPLQIIKFFFLFKLIFHCCVYCDLR
jgi:hypothetical protein